MLLNSELERKSRQELASHHCSSLQQSLLLRFLKSSAIEFQQFIQQPNAIAEQFQTVGDMRRTSSNGDNRHDETQAGYFTCTTHSVNSSGLHKTLKLGSAVYKNKNENNSS